MPVAPAVGSQPWSHSAGPLLDAPLAVLDLLPLPWDAGQAGRAAGRGGKRSTATGRGESDDPSHHSSCGRLQGNVPDDHHREVETHRHHRGDTNRLVVPRAATSEKRLVDWNDRHTCDTVIIFKSWDSVGGEEN